MTITYNFFGKNCLINRDLNDRTNLNNCLKTLDFKVSKTLFVNQIHSERVVVIDSLQKIYGEQNLPKADAIISNQTNIAIAIITADCAPILLFDEKNKIIGAVHAGWRGAKLGIIENAVLEMKNLGAKNIKAIIGPMIQAKSYEVSQDFYDDFLLENFENKRFFVEAKSAKKYLFDLNLYVENKLLEAGISEVENQKINTYEEEKYFSYRRATHKNLADCGRNISLINCS